MSSRESPGGVRDVSKLEVGRRGRAPSTIRNYQTELRLFSEYLTDARYGWAVECEREFGLGRQCATGAERGWW